MADHTQLRTCGTELMSLFDASSAWLDANNKLDRRNKTKLDDAQRAVRKITKVLDKKPVFGLFGQSQAGKSYLAHIILSNESSQLEIDLGNAQADFIADINPVGGGAEATGVVTRFSIDPVQDKDYPVLTRFMTLEDVCLVLCKAYFFNIKGALLDSEKIQQIVNEVRNHIAGTNNSGSKVATDVRFSLKDLQGSVERYFPNNTPHWRSVEESGLWTLCHEHLEVLANEPELFAKLMSVLWMGHSGLRGLATKLFSGLRDLEWAEYGRLKGDAVLGNTEQGGKDIINVDTLRKETEAKNILLEVKTDSKLVSLNVSHVSALTKEVVLNIHNPPLDENSYLHRADILDFPGARSEISHEDTEKDITRPFLRGKVDHLFEQYSQDFEINNLLFCIPRRQNDVTELPNSLKSWIERSIGESAESRGKLIDQRGTSPLMVIFTMFDDQLEFKSKDKTSIEAMAARWKTRFFKYFEEEMNVGKWGTNWTTTTSFKHVYLLRDFTFSDHTFSGFSAKDGSAENGFIPFTGNQTNDLYTSRAEFHSKLKESFITDEYVNRFIEDPETTWNECAEPNRNGSTPIINALQKASQTSGLATHAQSVMCKAAADLADILKKHHHSDDIAEAHQKAEALSQQIALLFNSNVASDRELLVALQESLALNAESASAWFAAQPGTDQAMDQNSVDQFLLTHPEIQPHMSPLEIAEAFRGKYGFTDRNEASKKAWKLFGVDLENLFNNNNGEQENPTVKKAIEHFGEELLTFDEDKHQNLLSLGANADTLRDLFGQLSHGLDTRKMTERISNFLAGQPSLTINGELDAARMGSLVAHHWNEYVFHISADFYSTAERENIQFTRTSRETNAEHVFDKLEGMFQLEPLANLPEVHFAPALSTVTQWHNRLRKLFLVNCGFANYDMAANEELGTILERLNVLSAEKLMCQ